jgi:phosphoribosylaminoimidazole-succinocarboxamide synthase
MSDKILYEGKSKIVRRGTDTQSYIIEYKDTATAFNGAKKEELLGKGVLNCKISSIIYGYLSKNGVKTHLLRVLDDKRILVKKAEIIMVEVIVRNIAAGGFSKKYGVSEGSALKNTTVEFSYKSDALGDPMINDSQITAIGLATQGELDFMKTTALKINALLCAFFKKAGIRLVDFKLEFGRCGGEIILCDEISPDSCRLWDVDTDEKLDKDRFRRNLGNVVDGYQNVLKRIQSV